MAQNGLPYLTTLALERIPGRAHSKIWPCLSSIVQGSSWTPRSWGCLKYLLNFTMAASKWLLRLAMILICFTLSANRSMSHSVWTEWSKCSADCCRSFKLTHLGWRGHRPQLELHVVALLELQVGHHYSCCWNPWQLSIPQVHPKFSTFLQF